MRVSLIVLTWNEAVGFKEIMPKINRKWVDEIIVVDGGSTDGTVELAKQMGFKVVVQKKHGRGNAFREGMENASGDVLVFFSPDGNEEPADIPKLVAMIGRGCDMVIASRFGYHSKSFDATFIRRLGNKFFTCLTNLLFGTRLTDAVNGFRAIRKPVMQSLNTTAETFEIETQMTIRCAKKGHKMCEIPTIEGKRISGSGKLSTIVDGTKYLLLILREAMGMEV